MREQRGESGLVWRKEERTPRWKGVLYSSRGERVKCYGRDADAIPTVPSLSLSTCITSTAGPSRTPTPSPQRSLSSSDPHMKCPHLRRNSRPKHTVRTSRQTHSCVFFSVAHRPPLESPMFTG
jgi:hypothetical protein